jgi:hypothetical protein
MPVMGVNVFEMPKPAKAAALAAAGLAPETKDIKDTIIVPAQKEGFDRVFLGQNAWWAIRVGEKYRPNLRWIAAYQTLPIAAITHSAEIDHFELYGDGGKWKVLFKAPAVPLERPIPYGSAPSGAMQGPRYTKHSALLSARTLADLLG